MNKTFEYCDNHTLLPPQDFGPDGQNPSRHPRGPRVSIREENFTVPEKISIFSRTGLARYCRNVRKGLSKLRWGSKKHSKESGSGVFGRDSEVEREEL